MADPAEAFARTALTVGALARGNTPIRGGLDGLDDAVEDLAWIYDRYERWPDAADRAALVLASLARLWLDEEQAERLWTGAGAGNPVVPIGPVDVRMHPALPPGAAG